jgi:hypothetical protein
MDLPVVPLTMVATNCLLAWSTAAALACHVHRSHVMTPSYLAYPSNVAKTSLICEEIHALIDTSPKPLDLPITASN